MIQATVKVNLEPLKRFGASVSAGMSGGTGPIRDAFVQWAARYRGFVRERFDKYSKGGGDWPPLAESTKRKRRGPRKGHKGSRSFSILRDTGTLFNALTPTFTAAPGQLQENIPFGIRVGYGGPAKHPSGAASIADLAAFHQTGAGRLPKREIIVAPDARTLAAMAGDMERGIARAIRESGS